VFLPEAIAGIFNVPQKGGFLVQKVVELSPSYIMGMQGGIENVTIADRELIIGGDIVLAIQDIILDNPEKLIEVQKTISDLETGDVLKVKILRKGKIQELTYTIPKP
jgi:serine protease Do